MPKNVLGGIGLVVIPFTFVVFCNVVLRWSFFDMLVAIFGFGFPVAALAACAYIGFRSETHSSSTP